MYPSCSDGLRVGATFLPFKRSKRAGALPVSFRDTHWPTTIRGVGYALEHGAVLGFGSNTSKIATARPGRCA
jgi:hypothetical protein